MPYKVDESKCIMCGACGEVCPSEAISYPNGYAFVDRFKCLTCGACSVTCPVEAIQDELFFHNEKPANKDSYKVLHFYADWCGPCKTMEPAFKEWKDEHPDVEVVDINIEEDDDTAAKYMIMSIPAFVFLKNNEEYERQVGMCSKDVLSEKLSSK